MFVNAGTPFRSSDHDPVLIGISLSPQPTTFAMWSAAHSWPGGTGSLATDDPDHDGLTNLEEFALNTDPLVPDAALAPTAVIDGANFDILYRLRTNSNGITVQPQWSENLLDWFPMTTSASSPLDALTNLQPATAPLTTSGRMFGRLRIDQP